MSTYVNQVNRSDAFAEQTPTARPQIIWRARFSIVGASLLIAGLTCVVSSLLPGTYSANSDVLVSSSSTMTSVDAVSGANELATQFAQFARTAVVLNDAAARSGIPVDQLSANTSAATVANTNIVRVTVKAGSADESSKGARAVSEALVAQTQELLSSGTKTNTQQLANIDELLAKAKDDVDRLSRALTAAAPGSSRAQAVNTQLNNAQQQVTALVLKRIDLVGQAGRDTSGSAVKLSALTAEPIAAKVAPQPLLYSLVALIVSLVLTTELAVISARRRQSGRPSAAHDARGRARPQS
ncbi:hypothetical protein OHA21_23300 [Actinoplanes sp. NBC_00393]|uniref:hypothetical protein n=1 Tax=Actinoplanes sp. NBC_00393 TaxID=2975953 RepID=UPI002E1D2A11